MKVRAKADGFYDSRRIREGEVFDLLPGHKPGKWMEPVEGDAKPARKKPEPEKVTTMSEMAKAEPLSRQEKALAE